MKTGDRADQFSLNFIVSLVLPKWTC